MIEQTKNTGINMVNTRKRAERGVVMTHCLDKCWSPSGFDIAEPIVEASREAIEDHGSDPASVKQGGIECLEDYDADSVDLLLLSMS